MATRYKPSWTSTVHSLKLRMRSSLFYLSSSHLLMFLTNFNWSSTLRDVKNKNRTNFTPNVLLYRASGKRKNALVFDNSPYSQFQTFYGEWSFIFTVTKYSITQQKKKLYLKIFSCACREVKKKKKLFYPRDFGAYLIPVYGLLHDCLTINGNIIKRTSNNPVCLGVFFFIFCDTRFSYRADRSTFDETYTNNCVFFFFFLR